MAETRVVPVQPEQRLDRTIGEKCRNAHRLARCNLAWHESSHDHRLLQIRGAVAEYERRQGRRPGRLDELVAQGLWRGPLQDAAGYAFGYDPSTGRVFITDQSPMWRPD
mgnify:CR=1 FL=1